MSTAPAPALAKTMSYKTESEKRVVATTLSMAGRVYKCCANACNESFPSMHQLMNHLKTHYKPNRYYKCPSCKSRFQKHQSYSKHVSVCGREVKRLPPELDPPARPPAAAEPVKFQSVIMQLGRAGSVPSSKPVALFPDTLPSLHSSLSSMPLLPATPHPFPLLEPSMFPAPSLRFHRQGHSAMPGPFIPYMHPAPYPLAQSATLPRLTPCFPSESLPFSNAVWKKNPAQTSSSRIVWEHSRGQYSCLQCPYTSGSREEMTLHIQGHNKTVVARLPSEAGMFLSPTDNYTALSMQFSESLLT
ncbi:zinc finger protein 414 [Leucoraja erinacea]|uniref:zinc finger protein 414 n=1 Tax=Leucoraja erinaceus TaxID=7782 RepID=UPI0024550161|nr:zinc finger protein 414 [Leucoraja erinacea]